MIKRLLVLATFCIGAASLSAGAATYPTKPVRVILPFAAGGQSDVVARIITAKMATQLGQPIVVENMGGAGGIVAALATSRATPDGYTLLFANASTLTIAPNLQPANRISPEKAFIPVGTATTFPLVLAVGKNSPHKTITDLVKFAKTHPGQLSYASPGNGTTPHLLAESLAADQHVELLHVPYQGGAPALNALLGGQVDFYFDAPAILLPQIRAGKVRAIAVTGRQRNPLLPDVQTVNENGMPQLTLESWSALMAPSGTDPAVIERLRLAMDAALSDEGVVAQLQERGYSVLRSSQKETSERIQREHANWARLIRERKIAPN